MQQHLFQYLQHDVQVCQNRLKRVCGAPEAAVGLAQTSPGTIAGQLPTPAFLTIMVQVVVH